MFIFSYKIDVNFEVAIDEIEVFVKFFNFGITLQQRR